MNYSKDVNGSLAKIILDKNNVLTDYYVITNICGDVEAVYDAL